MRNIIFILLLFGCSNTKSDSERFINERVGKKLILPSLYTYEFDTVKNCHFQNNAKMIVYIDGSCFVCLNDLLDWKRLIDQFRDNYKVHFIFYIYAFDKGSLIRELKEMNFNADYCIDTKQEFIIKNKLPYLKHFNTFLVNDKNIIRLVGNPILDFKIKDLYESEINKMKRDNNITCP